MGGAEGGATGEEPFDTCACSLHYWCDRSVPSAGATLCLSDPTSPARRAGAEHCNYTAERPKLMDGRSGGSAGGKGEPSNDCVSSHDGACDEVTTDNNGIQAGTSDIAIATCPTGTDCTDCGTCDHLAGEAPIEKVVEKANAAPCFQVPAWTSTGLDGAADNAIADSSASSAFQVHVAIIAAGIVAAF